MSKEATNITWTRKYWDAIEHLYWAPQYLGLQSIPQRFWTIQDDTVSIPRDMTNPTGPLYRRLRSRDEYWEYVRRQEEPLNHIFDLTFGIVPGDVIGEILTEFTDAGFGHSYDMIGAECWMRYRWGRYDNVTQPDGWFVAEGSVLGVELKFNAKTSVDQLAKYIMLFVAEEIVGGQRPNLDLLYIVNSDPNRFFEEQTGIGADNLCGDMFDYIVAPVKNSHVNSFLRENRGAVESALDRIRIHTINWQTFCTKLSAFSRRLGEGKGDRTLGRLIDGLVAEVARHPLSNVTLD